jgi:hypothetical protein
VRRRNQEAVGPLEEQAEPVADALQSTSQRDPDPSPDVRAAFERAMKDVYIRARAEANYTATYFVGMLSDYGGLGTAKRLLATHEVSTGFTALYERDRLDLTVEALLVQPRFASLFTPDEIETARQRLDQLGYRRQEEVS